MVSAVEPLLATYSEAEAGDHTPSIPPPPDEIRDCKKWEIQWDGSFDGTRAGLGITLSLEGNIILKASVPVYATDATRCEALGPALAALLLERLQWTEVTLKGDSMTVVRLLRLECLPEDVWLYNAT